VAHSTQVHNLNVGASMQSGIQPTPLGSSNFNVNEKFPYWAAGLDGTDQVSRMERVAVALLQCRGGCLRGAVFQIQTPPPLFPAQVVGVSDTGVGG